MGFWKPSASDALAAKIAIVMFVALLPFALPFGLSQLREYERNEARLELPRATGLIVSQDMVQISFWIRRPLLTIRVDGTSDTVEALLSASGANQFQKRVAFRYSGTPGEEVFLEGEDSPLAIATFVLGTPPLFIGVMAIILWRRRKIQGEASPAREAGAA